MIHEVLFCLLKSSLTENEESEFLTEIHNFLHPGEQNLLRKIMEVAKTYHGIIYFVENVLYSNSLKEDSLTVNQTLKAPNGLYIRAFCSGIHTVLKTYRDDILKLETMFLENPQLPLSYILCRTEHYKTMFHMLISMIQVIEKEQVHGCPLMGKLHSSINCGIEQVSNAAAEILKSINVVFYSQLCHWIIYGNIIDTQNEFFIRDGEGPDPSFLYPEQLLELTEQNEEESLKPSQNHSKFRKHPNVRNFYINWELVPVFLTEDIAESILFMGRIVWIIRNDPKRTRDVWEEKDIEYFKKIQSLQTEPFKIMKFRQTMDSCRLTITKYLWTVMLDDGNLIDHINLIRDYYVLGRGELFHQFIIETENHMKGFKTGVNIGSLNHIFYEAARKIYGDHDKTYLRFELGLIDTETALNPLYKLQINFQINWPLHILFHPKVIELYNKLFCFLLHLKKTQIDLHKLWHKHITEKQNVNRRVWILRQNLTFLVNNLQYYLQVDVIEAQFSLFLRAVKNANELEDIIRVHNEFLTNLLAKTFVLTPDTSPSNKKYSLYQSVDCKVPSKIYNVITRLLKLCDEFCVMASLWEPILTEPEEQELNEFEKRSDIIIETLLYTLYSLHEKANGQHLLQLINQLDFNKFFSTHKIDHSIAL